MKSNFEFYDVNGNEIRGVNLFLYAKGAIQSQTDRQYRKWVVEEIGEEYELEDAHEEWLTAKKIRKALNQFFTDEDILEIAYSLI